MAHECQRNDCNDEKSRTERASNPEYVKKLMDKIDEDGDGVINEKEFFGMMNNGTSALKRVGKKIAGNAQVQKVMKRKQSITERCSRNQIKKAVTQIKNVNLTEQEAAVVSTFSLKKNPLIIQNKK